MNTAAAAKPGRQRTASHSRIGNSKAIGRTVCHGSGGSKTTVTGSFAGMAESEGSGAPEVPVARNISNDGRNNYADGDRQSCVAPKRDQHAGGHARSRPEPANAVRFGEQRKAQLRREEIGNADRNSEPDRANPR